MLTCQCDPGSGQFYIPEDDLTPMPEAGRRCISCRKKLEPGEPVCKLRRFKVVEDYDPSDPFGGGFFEKDLRPGYRCERCWEMALNLEAAGYCFCDKDNLKAALREYQRMTGWRKPAKGKAYENQIQQTA